MTRNKGQSPGGVIVLVEQSCVRENLHETWRHVRCDWQTVFILVIMTLIGNLQDDSSVNSLLTAAVCTTTDRTPQRTAMTGSFDWRAASLNSALETFCAAALYIYRVSNTSPKPNSRLWHWFFSDRRGYPMTSLSRITTRPTLSLYYTPWYVCSDNTILGRPKQDAQLPLREQGVSFLLSSHHSEPDRRTDSIRWHYSPVVRWRWQWMAA